ncbi:MAG: RDD family protein [Novosphingobium sp.]
MTAAVVRHEVAAGKRGRVLVTPEGIALPIVLASRGTRFGALVLDLTLIALIMLATTLAAAYVANGADAPSPDRRDASAAWQFVYIVWVAAMFLFRNAWFLFFELGPRGATPGKRMTGIRIASRDGGRLTAEMVIARNLLRDVELFFPLAFILAASFGDRSGAALAATAWFLVFALFPFFNQDRLRAGDLIAGTWVVEAPKRKLAAAMSLGDAARGGASATTGAAYRFGEAELAVYGEHELQTLERVLRDDRPEALVAVHEAICAKLGWNPGAGDERSFLEAYYTQLRARLESGMRMGRRKADKFAPGG